MTSPSQPPVFTSAGGASLAAGTAGSVTITATGATTMAQGGTLPAGLSFTDNGNGTATLSGTPQAPNGTFSLAFTATNATGSTTQPFLLTIGPPLFLSAPQAVFTAGVTGTFTISASGDPTLRTGVLPPGLEFTDHGGGIAIVTGAPAPTTTGITEISITATSAGGATTQQFSLMISGSTVPAFTSAGQGSLASGVAGSLSITAPGALSMSASGTLPAGLTFTDNGNGTATLAGTPASANGTSVLTFSATNPVGTATQTFDLTIGPPLFLSAPQAVFTVGTAGSFTVLASGNPTLKAGVLPPGLEFTDHGGGTAVIAGTPAPTTTGIQQISITATSNGGATTQQFSLMISGSSAPEFSSASQAAFASNVFTITAPGALSIALSGTLPAGVQFTDHGGGTAVISGTPAATAANGSYPLTLTATNAVGSSTQSFNLTVS
jgi:putative Ig domain-containing protein